MRHEYAKDIIASGPLFKRAIVKKKKIFITFDYIGSGLSSFGKELERFEIAGADKQYVRANAVIAKDRVKVSASKVSNPKFVRYAWRDTSIGTLFNKEGLPASSFTMEE